MDTGITFDFDPADLVAVAARVVDNWTLCMLFDGTGRAAEKECMVAQTLRAAANNLKEHGLPFSFRGDNVFSVHGNGLADNATAYGYLAANDYFAESMHEGRPVIYPTRKLLDMVVRHLDRELSTSSY
jgi:hypothetical protein